MRSKQTEVMAFAESWIGRNINVGPFSCDDAGDCAGPIRQFARDAAQAGLTQAQLEDTLGPVAPYIVAAYAAASRAWLER